MDNWRIDEIWKDFTGGLRKIFSLERGRGENWSSTGKSNREIVGSVSASDFFCVGFGAFALGRPGSLLVHPRRGLQSQVFGGLLQHQPKSPKIQKIR